MLSFDHGKENLMAKNRFVKFMDSEESDFLLERYPNAFLLLALIAKRARRTQGHIDGLEIGDAHIGDHKSCGLSEREYRTAKEVLCKLKIIRIKQTCRNRQKSTTESTTVGTLVTLLDSRVFDINSKLPDDRIDDRPTTDRRPTDDEQECKEDKNEKKKEKIKKEKSPEIQKIPFRDHVALTQIEYDKLIATHGEELTSSMLDILDASKGSRGVKYKSDYHTMKKGGWVYDRATKEGTHQKKSAKLWMNFEHGKTYNGYDFLCDKGVAGFYKSNGISQQSYEVRLNDPNFDTNFKHFLKILGIELNEK